jgi:AraC-like DNA-binding protein
MELENFETHSVKRYNVIRPKSYDYRYNVEPVEQAITFMVNNFSQNIDLDRIASASGISKFTLCRKFQRRYRTTPMRWLWSFRSVLAAELMPIMPRWTLTDIAFCCGFSSSSHFSRSFLAMFGTKPSRFRDQLLLTTRHPIPVRPREVVHFESFVRTNSELIDAVFQRLAKQLTHSRKKGRNSTSKLD